MTGIRWMGGIRRARRMMGSSLLAALGAIWLLAAVYGILCYLDLVEWPGGPIFTWKSRTCLDCGVTESIEYLPDGTQ